MAPVSGVSELMESVSTFISSFVSKCSRYSMHCDDLDFQRANGISVGSRKRSRPVLRDSIRRGIFLKVF